MPALGLAFEDDRRERKRRPEPRRRRPEPCRRRRPLAASPDSGNTADAIFVSSASASASGTAAADRTTSFGSDLDAIFSQLTFSHLARREGGVPDSDREKSASLPHSDTDRNHQFTSTEPEDDEETLNPASHSFSLALRECQNRRFRTEGLSSPGRKPQRQRPVSLDLNGPSVLILDAPFLSPSCLINGAAGAKKRSTTISSRSRSGFPSPRTPSYRNGGRTMAYQRGCSSERVPLPVNSSQRHLGGGALLPFNNGRALPSKWEDAEKWICSPVSGNGAGRPSLPLPHHRRPKSKSGPLGPPAVIGGHYLTASPLIPCTDSARVRSFTAGSPFLEGDLVADGGCCGSYSIPRSGGDVGCGGDGVRRSFSAYTEPYIVRSASLHGWSDVLIESSSSLPNSQGTITEEKIDSTREASVIISPVVLRKDVATQMSPERSTQSFLNERPPFSPSPSSQPIGELESHLSKMEVRDVQVDDRVTVTRWSKKQITRGLDKHSANIIEWKKKTTEGKTSTWEVSETTKHISKYKREEAKITSWENLQKAKAEAAIRKLEMKLERKRSSSMERILNKLRSAQRKAREMRSAVTASQAHNVARTTKRVSYFRRTGQISFLSVCFTCHAI